MAAVSQDSSWTSPEIRCSDFPHSANRKPFPLQNVAGKGFFMYGETEILKINQSCPIKKQNGALTGVFCVKGIRLKKAVLSDFRFAVQMSHNVETHVILEIPYPYVLLQRKIISGLDHRQTGSA